jgi:hypothetical protein
MTRGIGILAIALAAAGCVTTTSSLKPLQVADHAAAILRDGRASVPTLSGAPVTVNASQVVHVRLRDHDGVERPVRLTVGELVAGCVGDTLAPGCLAASAIDDPMVLRKQVRVHSGKVASAIALGVAGSALGYCSLMCDNDDRTSFKEGAAATGVIVVGTFALLAFAAMH